MAYYLLGILILVVDQATKIIVEHKLPMGVPIEIIPGFFNLYHTRNVGGAFGLFPNMAPLFLVVGIVAVVVLMVAFRRFRYQDKTVRLSLALLIAGALGNIIDRIRLGYVIDFIQLYLSRFYWPAFNIADTSVVVGAVLILVFIFTHREKGKGEPDSKAENGAPEKAVEDASAEEKATTDKIPSDKK